MNSSRDLAAFQKACVDHGAVNPAGVPVENTVQEVALRLKQARSNVYTGPTAVFRQWAVHLLREPASQLESLIREADPPPGVRTQLTTATTMDLAASTRSILL